MKNKLSSIVTTIILAGIILIIIGFYFSVVKGGIPYQDPTVEMQIRWQAYHFAGECNIRTGIFLLLCGFLLKIVKWMKVKFQSED